MKDRLTELTLRGFRSIKNLECFRPGPLNVLIGANGAGKSNLISFFRFLSWALTPPGNLQFHIAKLGGASAILHDGAACTREIEAHLVLQTERGENEYKFRLFHVAGDTLCFASEEYRFTPSGLGKEANWSSLGPGHREAEIIRLSEQGEPTPGVILALLRKCVVYQFHNTSVESARMRSKSNAEDNWRLKEDGANLAPFLLRIQTQHPEYYHRIVETLRQILPFFADFELRDEYGAVLLRWTERGTDQVFSADQASDGMLRTIAVIALLMQPEDSLPNVLILDEPELGLHPYAISIVAGLLRGLAEERQVFVATQSATFVDQFMPEDIIVVDRAERESVFRRLDSGQLGEWLDDYSIAELWEKNVLGGRPTR